MDNQIVKYVADQNEIELSPEVVKKHLVRGQAEKITDTEVTHFIALCAYQKLNPFLKEAYLVKFGSEAAQLIVGRDVFTKRANETGKCAGWKTGITVVNKNGELERREGTLLLKGEELIGGWCTVWRTDWSEPKFHEVSLAEYDKGQATWKKMPATMISKVAEVQNLRNCFPELLRGLYDEAENVSINGIIDVTPSKPPVSMPKSKSATAAETIEASGTVQKDSFESTDSIPKCPECGNKLAATEEKAEAVIEYCTKNNKPVQCYNCQHKK